MGNLFSSAGLITSIFYIFIILFSKPNHKNKWLLLLFIVLLDLALMPTLLMNTPFFNPKIINVSFTLLWGPTLYFYILSLLKKKINGKLIIIHVLPFLVYYSLSLILNIDILPGPPNEQLAPNENISSLFNLIQLFSLIGYSIMTLIVLNKHQKNIQNHYSYNDIYLTIRWSYVIILFFVSAYVFILIAEQFLNLNLVIFPGDIQLVLLTIFIYILGYLGIKQQPVYLNMLDDVESNVVIDSVCDEVSCPSSKEKYLRNKLDDDVKEEYKIKLLNYIEKEKPYLQPKLSIDDLSNALEIPKHFISQTINDSLEHTFYSLINSYRVEEVKRRILDENQDKYTLLAIAFESGFNSKSGFNTNFKLETGMTPLEFKNLSNK